MASTHLLFFLAAGAMGNIWFFPSISPPFGEGRKTPPLPAIYAHTLSSLQQVMVLYLAAKVFILPQLRENNRGCSFSVTGLTGSP